MGPYNSNRTRHHDSDSDAKILNNHKIPRVGNANDISDRPHAPQESNGEPDEFSELVPKANVRRSLGKNHLNLALPPLDSLPEIFADLTLKAVHKGLRNVLENDLKGQSIKIATMCSGTESPIFALGLIKDG